MDLEKEANMVPSGGGPRWGWRGNGVEGGWFEKYSAHGGEEC